MPKDERRRAGDWASLSSGRTAEMLQDTKWEKPIRQLARRMAGHSGKLEGHVDRLGEKGWTEVIMKLLLLIDEEKQRDAK